MAATGEDNRIRVWSLSTRGSPSPLRDMGLKPWLQANCCAFSPEAWLTRWDWVPSLWCATDRGLAAMSYVAPAERHSLL